MNVDANRHKLDVQAEQQGEPVDPPQHERYRMVLPEHLLRVFPNATAFREHRRKLREHESRCQRRQTADNPIAQACHRSRRFRRATDADGKTGCHHRCVAREHKDALSEHFLQPHDLSLSQPK